MLPGKKLAMVVICLFILCFAAVAGAVELSDIDGHWAENDIRELVGIGAITGYPDGTYRPEGTITRAEFSSVLRGVLGLEEAAGATFPDTAGHWGQGRIEALILAGVIDTDLYGTHYRPDGSITREEIAMMTVRMLGEMTGATEIPFIDAGTVGEGFQPYVAEAYAQQIIFGYPDDTFRPRGTATRAEAAVMAIRALRILGMTGEEPPTIVSFSSDLDSLMIGAAATLSWEVSGAIAIAIDQNIGTVTPQGSVEVSPAATTTYTLTATNNAGSSTAQVTITVTSYTIIDPLPNGVFIPPPSIVHFSADKSGMTEGISATLSWVVSGIAKVTIEPGIGEISQSGTYVVSPTETTTYTLTASNVSGSTTETVTIKVRPALIIQPGPDKGKDVGIAEYMKNTPAPHAVGLRIGRMYGDVSRILIQFDDVNSIHPDTVIVSASLELYQLGTYYSGSQAHDFTTTAHRITTPWDINTATWNNPPHFQVNPLESECPVVAGAVTWLSWDITNLVQDWVSGSHPNYGVLLRKTNEGSGSTSILCCSSRYTDNSALRPRLVLTYYVP
jgi:hypothetical protein